MSIDSHSGQPRQWEISLVLVAAGVLLLCAFYIWAYAFVAPYPGLDYDAQLRVVRFDDICTLQPRWCAENAGKLQVGDQLLEIGGLTRQRLMANRYLVPFAGYQAGDLVPLDFVRPGGLPEHTEWRYLGPTSQARLLRLAGVVFVLPFWLAGTAVLLLVRPRDRRWLLLTLFNYSTALWIAVGIASNSRVAVSAIVLRVLVLLMMPIYVHLHLLVPSPLPGRWWRSALMGMYGLAVLLAVREVFRPLPSAIFYWASLVGIGGSLALLIFRSLAPSRRSDRVVSRLMLAGVGLGFGPGLLWVVPTLLGGPTTGQGLAALTMVSIPIQPFSYIYAIFKQRLGNLEFRVNRFLGLYSFVLLFSTAFVVAFIAAGQTVNLAPGAVAFTMFASLLFLALALWLQAPFQRLIERLAYGTASQPETIIRTFADQIPRALDRQALASLLTREVLPALLIRQSALYLLTDGLATAIYADGTPAEASLDSKELEMMAALSGKYLPPQSTARGIAALDWVRVVVPIEVAGQRIAEWLLGKRDPDDFYPRSDIELLRTLGNQIGVALETARLFENLQRRAFELETAYRGLQRLDELKDAFVQNVSHELRTPLTFVRGYTDLLLEEILGPLNVEQRQALTTVGDRTEGIIQLVNDIISLQQAQAEELEREPVNLPALARSCVEALEVASRKEDAAPVPHSFRLELMEDVPPVLGDRRRLAQVIDNLLSNAVKFSPGGGEITVRVGSDSHELPGTAGPQPVVCVEVSDQGVGIPDAELDQIWQRFYQVDSSSRRRFGGMGLGLAIVRAIVDAHQGIIWAESQLDQGTTFHLVLPAQVSAGEEWQPESLDKRATFVLDSAQVSDDGNE